MPSLTTCAKKAGDLLRAEDRQAIMAQARALQKQGMARDAAALQALDDRIAEVEGLLEKASVVRPVKVVAPEATEKAPPQVDETSAPQFARAEEAPPEITTPEVTLGFAQPTERMEFIPTADNQQMYNLAIMSPDGEYQGYTEVLFVDGKPTTLYDIELSGDKRGAGMGRKAVRALLDATENGRLEISNIIPSAQGFWEKLGIGVQNHGENAAYDGVVTRASIAAQDADKDGGPEASLARPVPGEDRGQQDKGKAALIALLRAVTPSSSGPMTTADVRENIADLEAKWDIPVRVVQTPADLPGKAPDDARGLHYNGAIYLVAQNNPTRASILRTLGHEAIAHYGLEHMLGEDGVRDMAAQIQLGVAMGNKALVELRNTVRKAYVDDAGKFTLSPVQEANEIAAYAVERGIDPVSGEFRPGYGWLKAVFARVAKFLRGLGLDVSFTNAELQGALVNSMRNLERRAKPALAETPVAAARGPDGRFARTPEWISTGPAGIKSAAGKIDTYAPQKSITEKIKALTVDWQTRLVQGMVDAYAPLKELSMEAYIAARMVKSADGVFEGMLSYGKPVMAADGSVSGDLDHKGFIGFMKELHGEHDRFFMWLAGNRSAQLATEGRENLFNAAEIRDMQALNQGKMADGTPRAIAYSKAHSAFNAYNKSVLDIAERTGIVDGDARALWEKEFYVPFFRVHEDETISGPSKVKGLVRQKTLQQLKGGTDNLGDLMENTLRNWSRLLSASLANQAASKSLNAAEGAGIAFEADEESAREMAKSFGKKSSAVYFMDAGKQRWFVVEDPFVLEAISAMEPTGMNSAAMQAMRTAKHWLTVGVTIGAPFRVGNLMRDSIAAVAQNDMSYNVMNNLVTGWKSTAKESNTYAQMLFGGALMRFGNFLDGGHARHVKRLIASGVDEQTILDTPDKIKAAWTKNWDRWQELGDRMENVNRAAYYEQLRASGKSHLEASYAARDMMDFSMGGSWPAMRVLTGVVPFLNARVQGLAKLARSAKEDPKRVGYVVGAVALTSIALMLGYGGDDDWKAREDWDRDSFWWFKIGSVAYRVPKPFEIGALGTIAERSLELMISDEMTGKRFAERMKQMVLSTFAMNPVPQLFKPWIDLYANQDSFTGREIETQGMEHMSKPERAGPGTSDVAKVLGKAGNATNLSPVQIDHLIRGYFGWLGVNAVLVADSLIPNDAPRPAAKLTDFSGGFVKSLPAAQSRYVTEFYDQAKAVAEVMADIKHARETGDIEKAKELQADERAKVATHLLFSRTQRTLSKVSAEIRSIQNNRTMDADAKRVAIDRLNDQRNDISRQTVVRAREASAL